MMFEKVDNRKNFSVFIFVLSLLNLLFLLYITDFLRGNNDFNYFVNDIKTFFVVCPQAISLPILSILVYLSSPWKLIYFIYLYIWSVVFLAGSVWTSMLGALS